MPWQPGESGNPTGGRKARIWRRALERAVTRAVGDKVDYTNLDAIADSIVAAAVAGDVQAIKEIGDRIDGKVPQAHVGSDDPEDGGPINHNLRVEFVKPEAADAGDASPGS